MKNTRSSTGVTVSSAPIWLPLTSSLRIPPIKVALIVPPNICPSTLTAIEAISVMGNSPSSSRPTSILTPSIAPENVSPASPLMPVTDAERIIEKLVGSFVMSSHWMPSSVIRTGSHDGQPNASPLVPSAPMKTPNPASALKLPLPMIAKLRPSPLSVRLPILISAPIWVNRINSWSLAAPVSSRASLAVKVTMLPSVTRSVSDSNLKPSTRPSVKVIDSRIASVSVASSRVSVVVRSETVALKDPPGKSFAPPVATKMLPVKSTVGLPSK